MLSLAGQVLVFALLAVAALLTGAALLRLAGRPGASPAERVLLAWALGLGALAYAVLALGLLGQLTTGALAAVPLAGAVLGLLTARGILADLGALLCRAGRALARGSRAWVWWALLVWSVPLLLISLLPPGLGDWDGLSQHLAMTRQWLLQGALVPLWYDHHSQFPATVQMLYLLGQALGGGVTAKFFHLLLGVLSLGAVGLLARRHYAREAAPWAVAIFAATPLVSWLLTVAYVDFGAVLYLTLAVHWFLHWQRRQTLRPALAGGLFLGLALGTKIQALLYAAGLALVALLLLARAASGRRRTLGQLLALAGLALLVGGPWYVKSWLLTGNPVYPFAYGVFGGKQWSEGQARQYTYEQKSWGWGELPPVDQYWDLPPAQRFFAGPRQPDRLLLLPFSLTFLPERFVDRGYVRLAALLTGAVGPLYLALLPLLLLRRPRPPAWGLTLWVLLPPALELIASAQYSRYFLPGLALLAAPAGLAAAEGWRRGRPLRQAVVGGVVCMLLVAFLFQGQRAALAWPLLAGQITQEQYLAQVLPVYPALAYLNRVMPPQGRLISYGEPRLYYLERPYLWGDPGYHRLLDYDRMATGEDLWRGYRSLGITHVLVNLRLFTPQAAGTRGVLRLLQEATQAGLLRLLPEPDQEAGYLLLEVTGARSGRPG